MYSNRKISPVMRRILAFLLCGLTTIVITGCGVPKYATISNQPDLSKYKYVYITPTGGKNSVTGGTYSNEFGVYGSTSSKSTSPSDLIAGRFMKQGFVRLPEISEVQKQQTLVVNYGESGRKVRGFGYSIEVTIQLLDAATYELVCSATAEGMGETEADDVRKAIVKCLNAIFN